MNADDLDDGLAYEVDISDNEKENVSKEPEATPKAAELPNPKKRAKAQLGLHDKKKLRMEMDIAKKQNLAKELAPEVIADYINDQIRRKNPDLSALELAEKYLHKSDIRSTAELPDERKLDNLLKFVLGRFKNMLPQSKLNKKGTKQEATEERKFVAILSMSAIRACDVHRCLRDIPGSSLKLINKNKIDVDLKLVKSTWSRVLCCTPGRLQKVLNTEDLPLKKSEIKIVILDHSYLDKKMQNIFNIQETTDTLKELTNAGAKVYLY